MNEPLILLLLQNGESESVTSVHTGDFSPNEKAVIRGFSQSWRRLENMFSGKFSIL